MVPTDQILGTAAHVTMIHFERGGVIFVCSSAHLAVCFCHLPIVEFLAAMSSSRSDHVTKSVCVTFCPSGVILFSLEHSKHLKQNVLREFQGCLRGVCL